MSRFKPAREPATVAETVRRGRPGALRTARNCLSAASFEGRPQGCPDGRRGLIAKALLLLLLGASVPAMAASDGDLLFTLTDPRGDDTGDGTLVYPQREDMERGDLDLLTVSAYAGEEGTEIEIRLGRKIRPPERKALDFTGTSAADLVRLGFYTFNIDIYIDTDRQPGSGELAAMPGRNVEIDPASAWEKAILLTPRPQILRSNLRRALIDHYREYGVPNQPDRQLPDDQLRRLADEELKTKVFCVEQVHVAGNKLSFVIPTWFLGGLARPDWSYVVAVSGAEIQQRFRIPFAASFTRQDTEGMILPVEAGRPDNAFGGGRPGDHLQPPLIDVLVPAGTTQHQVLTSYNRQTGTLARLPGVVPLNDPSVLQGMATNGRR